MLDAFVLLAYVYVALSLVVLVRVVRAWTTLLDDDWTSDDRRLADRAGFYLGVPIGVLVHELGHAVTVELLGLDVVAFAYYGFVGFVVPSGSAGPLGDFAIALSGNLVTVVLALAIGGLIQVRPLPVFLNVAGLGMARQLLFVELVFYPALALFGFGDFAAIYDARKTPLASAAVALAHLALLVGWWRGLPVTSAHRLWISTDAPAARRLWLRLRRAPGDHAAAEGLGVLYGRHGAPAAAERLLAPLADRGALSPAAWLELGAAGLALGRHELAARAVAEAEARLFHPADRARLAALKSALAAR